MTLFSRALCLSLVLVFVFSQTVLAQEMSGLDQIGNKAPTTDPLAATNSTPPTNSSQTPTNPDGALSAAPRKTATNDTSAPAVVFSVKGDVLLAGGGSYVATGIGYGNLKLTIRSDDTVRIENNGEVRKGTYSADSKTIVIDESFPGRQIVDITTIQLSQKSSGEYEIQSIDIIWKDYANNTNSSMSYIKTSYQYQNGLLKILESESLYKSLTVSRQHEKEHKEFEHFMIDGIRTYLETVSTYEASRPSKKSGAWSMDPVTGEPDFSINYYVASESKTFKEYDSQGNLTQSVNMENEIDHHLWLASTSEIRTDGTKILNSTESVDGSTNSTLFDAVESVGQFALVKSEIQASNSYYKVVDQITLPTARVSTTTFGSAGGATAQTSTQLDGLTSVTGSSSSTGGNQSLFLTDTTSAGTGLGSPIDLGVSKIGGTGLTAFTSLTPGDSKSAQQGDITVSSIVNEDVLPGLHAEQSISTTGQIMGDAAGSNPVQDPVLQNQNEAFPVTVVLPTEVRTQITLPVTQLNIAIIDKNAFALDLERLTGLLIQMPYTRDLSSVDFKNYLGYLQETLARLMKLAEKYKDDKEVQKAIQDALINIVEYLLKNSQENTLSETLESDLALFEELLKQERSNANDEAQAKVLDQKINAVLEVLRRETLNQSSTALQRTIYRSWYFSLVKKYRLIKMKRTNALEFAKLAKQAETPTPEDQKQPMLAQK